MKSIINREQAELKQRFLLGGGPLGRIPIPPGPHGVQGEDGGADSDGGHDRHIYVEDAIKVVAHGGEHGLQFHRPICGQDMQSGSNLYWTCSVNCQQWIRFLFHEKS